MSGKKILWESAVASLVAGMALAAGAEAWSWVSPMRRKEREDAEDDDGQEVEVEEVENGS